MNLTISQSKSLESIISFIDVGMDITVSQDNIHEMLNKFRDTMTSVLQQLDSIEKLSTFTPILNATCSVVLLCGDHTNNTKIIKSLQIMQHVSLSTDDNLILLIPLGLGFISAMDVIDDISFYKHLYRYIKSALADYKNKIEIRPIEPSEVIGKLIQLGGYLDNSSIEHYIESLKFDLFGKYVDLMGCGLNEDNDSNLLPDLLEIFNVSLIGLRLSNIINNTKDDSTLDILTDMRKEEKKINDKLFETEPLINDILSLIIRFFDNVLSNMFTTTLPDMKHVKLLELLEFSHKLCQLSNYHVVVCYYTSYLLKLLKSENINDSNIVELSTRLFELIKSSKISYSIDIGELSMIVKEIQSSKYWNPEVKLNCTFRSSTFTRYSNQDNKPLEVIRETFIPDFTDQKSIQQYLTEGFKIESDGTIKVEINSKKTFISEYSINHKLLKLNEKRGDYEGMKYNLVYHLILINNLEQNIIHDENVSQEMKDDAMKAIRFAKNDISIYLPKLQDKCKDFDLNAFYRKVDADNNTIKLDTVSTVSGIKKIIKTILL